MNVNSAAGAVASNPDMLAGGLSDSDTGLASAADALIGPFDEEANTDWTETEALHDSVSDLPDLGMQAYCIASSSPT
jgi:hypothetical protein